MDDREYGSFTMSIDGREWNVDVAREVAEDALGIDRISGPNLVEWVDDNAVHLSDIAKRKIESGDHGSNWVKITSADMG